MRRHPPRMAERWLRSVIRDADAREGVLGDLREGYDHVARRFTIVGAHLWYWFSAVATLRWYVFERLRERRRGHGLGERYDASGMGWVKALWFDSRFAFRTLRRTPTFSGVAVLTIALGIGATTAIFTVLDGVVLKPLPYDEADRVVRISHTAAGRGIEVLGATDGMYFHYGENARTLEDFAIYLERSVPAGGDEDEAFELGLIIATPSLFSILDVSPLLGRLFTEEEIQPGVDDVVVLTHKFWTTRFGGDSTVIGQPLSPRSPIPIVGVLPEWFDFIRPEAGVTFGNSFDEPDIILPLTLNRARARFGNFMYQAIGRLAPEATLADATNELTVLMHQMPALYPENGLTEQMVEEGGITPVVTPLKDALVGDVVGVLWILMGAVGFVLLIAMVNVLNLFVVRAESRRREIAVRKALGASGGTLVRAFLSEGLLLAAAGGGLGVALAAMGTRLLLRLAPPEIPRLDQVGVDGRVLAFAFAISIGAAVILGLLPAIRYRKLDLAAVVGDQSRGATMAGARHRARHALVVTQVAFALVLLVGSGLLVRTFWNLRNIRPGFGGSNVLTVRVTLPGNVGGPQGRSDFMLDLTQRLEGVPGVEAAAFAGDLPLDGTVYSAEIALEGSTPEPGTQAPSARRNFIGPGYFRSIGATMLQGREMERRDYTTDPDVVVVNRAFASERWPGEEAIGKRLVQWPAEDGAWYRVIGVVADIREASLAEAPEPQVYLPTVFRPGTTHGMFVTNFAMVLQTSGDPFAVLSAVRREIANSGSVVPITMVQTLDQLKAASMRQLSFAMVLLVTAGTAALLLGIVGIYGVVAYIVGQRTREFGVRIALGAQAGDVRRMVLGQGARVGAIGIAIGLVGSLAMSRVLQSLLFGVSSTDVLTYAIVSLGLLTIVLAATFLPAQRATTVDLVEALRAE